MPGTGRRVLNALSGLFLKGIEKYHKPIGFVSVLKAEHGNPELHSRNVSPIPILTW